MTKPHSSRQPKTMPMSGLYRTIWRWHFYAGLIVSPFMLILAVTGSIYLFKDDINDALYPKQHFVAEAQALPTSRLIAAALQGYPGGSATRIDMPTQAGRSALVFVTPAKGEPERVYVDPGTAEVLGSFIYTRTLIGFADVFHGSLMLGDRGDAIVELMACWGLILVVTGLYLWMPRRRAGQNLALKGALVPDVTKRGRMLWRNLHAVTGAWTAVLIAFLILTGLPWATVWGGYLKQGMDAVGIGYPTSHRLHGAAPSHGSQTMVETVGEAPWTLENAPVPKSNAHAGHRGGGTGLSMTNMHDSAGIGVDDAVNVLHRQGMTTAYRLSMPTGPDGVYTAYTYPNQPQGQRTLHIDQYDGRVLGDIRFADYGWGAKAVEMGVQLHMGTYFGRANQVVMLIACLGVVLLSVTGPIMWWFRRPKGSLGAPRELEPLRLRTMALITLSLSVLFPLAGLSLAVVLVMDVLWRLAGRFRH